MMNIDEAIKYAEDLGTEEENKIDYDKDSPHMIICRKNTVKDYRQLAEWLTDYKGLRAEIIDLRLYVQMLEEYREKAKRLLKVAVEDMKDVVSSDCGCRCCKGEQAASCAYIKCWTWRYADEALAPINGFGLTTKGFESATYKKANKILDEEYRRLAEMTEEEIQREMEQEG